MIKGYLIFSLKKSLRGGFSGLPSGENWVIIMGENWGIVGFNVKIIPDDFNYGLNVSGVLLGVK